MAQTNLIGKNIPGSTVSEKRDNSINKYLFDSIGEVPPADIPKVPPADIPEVPPADIPEVEPVIRPEPKKEQESEADTTSSESDTKGQEMNFVPPPVSESDEPAALDKKVTNKFMFFIRKQLQAKPEPDAAKAILTKREPYLMIQNVTDALKQLKVRRNSKQLDSLIYAVKKLEEKLSVESDFGCGKSTVINCENNIARQIQFLLDTVPCIENGDFEENLKAMNTAVMNINSLLRRRIELKKK